jgi:hypothetical protein
VRSGFEQLETDLRAAAARLDRDARLLAPARRKKARSRLILALSAVVTIAIAVGAIALMHSARRPTTVGRGQTSGASSVRKSSRDGAGWMLSYPPTFHLERSESALARTIASLSYQPPRVGIEINGRNRRLRTPATLRRPARGPATEDHQT